MKAVSLVDTIGVRYYSAGDFIAGNAFGCLGAFDPHRYYYPD